MQLPPNYQAIMPYLVINNAPGFIEFTKQVFNATEAVKVMRDENIIMHGEVIIGGCTIMFADSTEAYGVSCAGLFIYVEDADETYQKALNAGASVLTALSDQSYGRSGGVTDPFGNSWWITSVTGMAQKEG